MRGESGKAREACMHCMIAMHGPANMSHAHVLQEPQASCPRMCPPDSDLTCCLLGRCKT